MSIKKLETKQNHRERWKSRKRNRKLQWKSLSHKRCRAILPMRLGRHGRRRRKSQESRLGGRRRLAKIGNRRAGVRLLQEGSDPMHDFLAACNNNNVYCVHHIDYSFSSTLFLSSFARAILVNSNYSLSLLHGCSLRRPRTFFHTYGDAQRLETIDQV